MNITPEVARELLHYNPKTGVLTWRERDRSRFRSLNSWAAWNARFSGRRAGSVSVNSKSGYQCREIRMFGRLHKEHRLAWMWMTDEPLPHEIDHENRDATDNRWLNLRASNRANNQRNISRRRDNTSGTTGVCWHRASGRWIAQCSAGGRQHYLGIFVDREEAARVVAEFRAANGYDPGHGVEPARYHQEASA